MPRVQRITPQVLDSYINNSSKLKKPLIIKLYSNSCHLCHSLRQTYERLSNKYLQYNFYACNVEDEEGLEEKYGFSGVPTILKIEPNSKKPKVLADPSEPDKFQWYPERYLEDFLSSGSYNG